MQPENKIITDPTAQMVPPEKKETPEERKNKERKYKSKTQRRKEWEPRKWAKKYLKDEGGMPTEQKNWASSSDIEEYWKNAVPCERCISEKIGGMFCASKRRSGYLKLMFSWKRPFISKKWYCSDCYKEVGGILLGYGDLSGIKPVPLAEKFPNRYCSECGRLKKGNKK